MTNETDKTRLHDIEENLDAALGTVTDVLLECAVALDDFAPDEAEGRLRRINGLAIDILSQVRESQRKAWRIHLDDSGEKRALARVAELEAELLAAKVSGTGKTNGRATSNGKAARA
jgi:hypothetical protein